MSKQTTKSSARTSTKSAAENNDLPKVDVINPASTTSDPSVFRAPDGTNTGMAETTIEEAKIGDLVGDVSNIGTNAITSISASDPSQGDADGAGANASSVEQQSALDNIFSATGAATLAELVSLCALGRNVILAIESVVEDDPALQKWLSDENPCGIISELAAENAVLNDLLDTRTTITADPERRRFVIERDCRLDNVLFEAGDTPALTQTQHADVVAATACTTRWEDGAEI
jgi:hypothetical protein